MTETSIKGICKKASIKTKIMVVLVVIFSATLLCYAFYEMSRPADLSDLNPEDYRDNPELYEFAKGLIEAENPHDKDEFLSDFYRNEEYPSTIRNDKRFVDILVFCLHERETSLQKLIRFFSDYLEGFAFSDLVYVKDDWNDFWEFFSNEDEKSGIRQEALGKLAMLKEKAYPALPEIYKIMYDDPVVDLREEAVFILGEVGASESFEHLLNFVDDEELNLEYVGYSLGQTAKTKKHIQKIVSFLDNDRLKKIAFPALQSANYHERPLWDELYGDSLKNELYEKIGKILMSNLSVEVRTDCMVFFKSLPDSEKNDNDKIHEWLGKALMNDPSSQVRIKCIDFFRNLPKTEIDGKEKIHGMIGEILMNDPASEVRIKCIDFFDNLPWSEKNSNDKLYDIMGKVLISDSETEVRILCLDYFDGLRCGKSFEILLEALKEEKSTAVKMEFIETLGSYRNSFDILKEFILEENEVEIKLAAIRKMGKLYWGSGNSTKRRIGDFLLLLTKNPSTIDVVRDKCLEQLSFMHKKDSEDLIIEMIKRRYRNRIFTRKEIDVICSTRMDKRAEIIDLLLEILNEQITGGDSFMTSENICYLIEKLSGYCLKEDKEKMKGMLLKLLDEVPEQQPLIRDALILELAEFGHQESIECLINKLVKEKNDNEKLILSHIGNWKSQDLLEYLSERLNKSRDNELLLLIFKSCNLDDAKVISRILEIIYDESFSDYTRVRAIQGLWRTKTTLAIEGIRKLTNDSELPLILRIEAVDGFKTPEFKKYLTFVGECLRHENIEIRKRAVQALWIRLDRDILLLFKQRVQEEEDKELKESIEYIISRLENDYHI